MLAVGILCRHAADHWLNLILAKDLLQGKYSSCERFSRSYDSGMAKSPNDLISVADVAGMFAVSSVRVRQYISEGRLQAQKVGRDFVVRRGDAEKFKPQKHGRPPAKK